MLRKKDLLPIYYVLFLSIATYGIIAWEILNKNIKSELQIIQNKLIRIVYDRGKYILRKKSNS